MLDQVDFDLLVNTTVIPSHFEVTLAALETGKHVYTQKPMSTTLYFALFENRSSFRG